jgi:3',5'-cyclic AMP phosphodiesterase CpdA
MVSAGTIHVLQITDLHLLPVADARLLGVDTARSLDAVLRSALSQRLPDALLVTGDIAHTPADATYARARELIAARFRGPALWLAGNHDLTTPLSAARPAADEFEMASWSVIAIDTHVDGREGGWIADAELDRLRERVRTRPPGNRDRASRAAIADDAVDVFSVRRRHTEFLRRCDAARMALARSRRRRYPHVPRGSGDRLRGDARPIDFQKTLRDFSLERRTRL